ncbi:hypothetical protein ACIQ9P_25460 [Kitasatospora sp. NPDC094019]|uniref:hypothetical protein n=1 Tax=Kitasatospora sp. NPDC094019 TaxID=3364091 RepID=UPI00380321E5
MRLRTLTTVSAFTALTFATAAPAAHAADPSAPATSPGYTVRKLTPEEAGGTDTAGTGQIASGPRTQGRVICFQARTRSGTWTAKVCSDGPGFTGTEGRNDPIVSVRFWVGTVGDMDLTVALHFAEIGTLPEVTLLSGDAVEIDAVGRALEAIHLQSDSESMKAAAHVQNVGWKGTDQWSYDQWIGSIGEGRWMEAFWIDI